MSELFNQAKEHHNTGRPAEAASLYRQALAADPRNGEILQLAGIVHFQLGQTEEGLNYLRQAVAANPGAAVYHGNLAAALVQLGRFEDGIEEYQQALRIDADSAELNNDLATVLNIRGRFDEAIASARRAIALRADFSKAHYQLASALFNSARWDESIEASRQGLAVHPEDWLLRFNWANALIAKGLPQEAIPLLREVLREQPNAAEVHNSVALCLQAIGQIPGAIEAFEKAVEISPHFALAQSNRLYALYFDPKFDAQNILQAHREWNKVWAEPLKKEIRPHDNDRNPDRKLRIGYVSPDFRAHVVGRNILPLLREHDKQQFELFCYANSHFVDSFTERFQASADGWRNIAGMDDVQAAELIRADRIDILIDLALHMNGNRILIFARKPAPVQITFAGYPGTTGLNTIDYRLTDPFLDPASSTDSASSPRASSGQAAKYDGDYSEQSIRLPNSFWCYDADAMELAASPEVNSLPAISNGFITFGCLNNFCKVNEFSLAIWSKVLQAIPNSRLILMSPPGEHRNQLLKRFPRVEFVEFQRRQQYLQTYHRIDIGLDTFPYNGHTTSLDSFWMGVPVISLMGNTVVSRAGFSQASNLGLNAQLVAQNEEQFVDLTKLLASDLNQLNKLRVGLRQRMENSPLMDSKRFARDIESVYRKIWNHWTTTPRQPLHR